LVIGFLTAVIFRAGTDFFADTFLVIFLATAFF